MKKRVTYLSELYSVIGKYLEEHGDAQISTIATHCNNSDKLQYSLDLREIGADPYEFGIKEDRISVKYHEVEYN